MAISILSADASSSRSEARAKVDGLTTTLYAVLGSSLAIVIGLIWDISWHRTIGRDSFWTAAHVLEQAAAIVTGLSCGWLVLKTTFAGTADEKARSVRFWGFRGPLGAWVCIWGTLMMITSAPFDNWWHNAYGLDVEILSPPHSILGLGMIGIQLGALLMIIAAQNRAPASESRKFATLFVISAGILVCMKAVFTLEYAGMGNEMHSVIFYRVVSIAFPIGLVAIARASRLKWAATWAALVYMAVNILMGWVLQLFPATPMLAPIYNPVTHMVPPPFPLLLVFPAIAIDMLTHRYREINGWIASILFGVVFLFVMLATHWPWGNFMISPMARNFVFMADQWSYTERLGEFRYRFWHLAPGPLAFLKGLVLAVVYATASARLGIWIGNGLARVKR